MSMICHLSNNLKLFQISYVYLILILISLGLLVSNPNWTAMDRRGGRYRPSTSRFQKSDMVRVAVRITSLFTIGNTVIIAIKRRFAGSMAFRLFLSFRLQTLFPSRLRISLSGKCHSYLIRCIDINLISVFSYFPCARYFFGCKYIKFCDAILIQITNHD